MTDLADFLRARYAERRQAAMNAALTEGLMGSLVDFLKHEAASVNVGPSEQHYALQAPGAVLADLDAKLALLEDLLTEGHAALRPGGSTEVYCDADYGTGGPCDCGRDARVTRRLRILARPFAGHPDYQEDWAA
ncbi:DUF6221 family protein [Streptomyces sp. f150]|uniref:DUF6221 family protein n=1 Tax=Streptomyces sp. f150 TaxID=1827699 RepID=UPI000BEFB0B4|nr:DUF6221 family protein [Streptomyces sp. f150]